MKILYLANARIPTPRAYGLQIIKTCEAFARRGATVELVTPVRRANVAADPFEYYRAEKNFTFTRLAVPDLLAYGSLGFFVSALWFSEKARWRKSFRSADIIYSRDAPVLLQYVLRGRPLVFEAHARPTLISAFVARRAKKLIVISNGLKEAYERAGVMPDKIIVAPDAVDEHLFDNAPDRHAARAALGLPINTRAALYAGHLYERKGADTVAAAAGLLSDVSFVFVGGANPEFSRFKEKWGSAKNIRIAGHVPHEEIPAYLRAADILVLPNSGKDEDSARYTSPMKLFEYMASGTPIVASDVPAIREVLDDSTAILVTPDSPTALADGIDNAIADPAGSSARAVRAQALAKRYAWQGRADKILSGLN